MKNKDLQTWLKNHDSEEELKCWIQFEDEGLSSPNMATIEKDEIFDWQDKLDDIDYVDDLQENMFNLFDLFDDFLNTLESRLQLNPEFVQELTELHKKIEDGDTSDFVSVELPKRSLWDYINDLCDAQKIAEYVSASKMLIFEVKDKLDAIVTIEDGKLCIKQKDNASISTSIISYALDIEAKDINDSKWDQGIWTIILKRR